MNGINPEARAEREDRQPAQEPHQMLPSIECHDLDGDLIDMPVHQIACVQYNRKGSVDGKLIAVVTCQGNDFHFDAEAWREASADYFMHQLDPRAGYPEEERHEA